MPLLLPEPEQQFCDANGAPYAGGYIFFFIPGTDTPKDTWSDHDGTVLNANPLTLDAAGRAIIFGDGDYRLVLFDHAGNLIYDQWTSSVVSDAMQPVVRAATIAEAQALLGITDSSAEITSLQNQINTLTTNLAAETSRAEAAEANLQSQIDAINSTLSGLGAPSGGIRSGTATTNATGLITCTFSPAFASGVTYFTIVPPTGSLFTLTAQPPDPQPNATIISMTSLSASGATVQCGQDTGTGPSGYLAYGAGVVIPWYAVGH